MSEYSQDRIHRAETGFTLRENGVAEFRWASEWTHFTANNYPEKKAILVWKFRNGTRAYSHDEDFFIGDLGKIVGYLVSGAAKYLQDIHGKKIQPMTRSNYPVELELWIGEIDATTGYVTEVFVDRVCFDAEKINLDLPHHFSDCNNRQQQ